MPKIMTQKRNLAQQAIWPAMHMTILFWTIDII